MADDISFDPVPLTLASRIVAAYVSHNKIDQHEIGRLLAEVHRRILAIASGSSAREPAVPVDKSVTKDHIICLEDGNKLRTLKRYLRTHYDLSPQEYREKWGLPGDYPMTAPGYSRQRSRLAKEFGLGKAPAPKRKKRKARKARGGRPRRQRRRKE